MYLLTAPTIAPGFVVAAARVHISPRLTIARIQRVVADFYEIDEHEMRSARRGREVARPRQVAMYLAKKLTPKSLPDIGRRFGGRDHTTVIHALKQIERIRIIDAELDLDVSVLSERLSGETKWERLVG